MKLATVSGWYVYGPCDRCGLTSYCETVIEECAACGLGRQSRNDNNDGLLQIVDSAGEIAYDANGLEEDPMPKLREIEVSYSRTVQVKQYEPETASCRLVAVYQEGEQEDLSDLQDLSNRAQDEVLRALGLEDDGTAPERAAVHGGTVVTRVTPPDPSSPPASADTAAVVSRRTRSSASSAPAASASAEASSASPLASAETAVTGRSRSRSTPSTVGVSAGQSEVNPPSSGGRSRSSAPAAETSTTAQTQTTISPSEAKKYKLTDVTKACSEVADRLKNPMIVLELLEEFHDKAHEIAWIGEGDGEGKPLHPCTLANQLREEDYAEFIQLCADTTE